MTALGALLAVTMIVLAVRRDAYPWALAIGGLTPAGVAAFGGGFPVPTFYAASLGVVVALAAVAVARRGNPAEPALPSGDSHHAPSRLHPGVVLLWVFVAWSVAVTLVAPSLFAGVEVLQNGETRLLLPGLITKSNLAQIVYLVLSVSVVTYLARGRSPGVKLIGLIVGGITLLSFWRLLSTQVGLPFPESLLVNSPTLNYIETDVDGSPRFRGILAEPSSLGAAMLAMLAYGAAQFRHVTGPRRWGLVALVAMAAWMGYISTAGTFVAGLALLILLALIVMLLRTLIARRELPVGAIAAGMAVIALLPFAVPPAVAWFLDAVRNKVGSTSYADRLGGDAHAFGVLADTFGLGAGLGAERPSSFIASLLGTTGVVGTLLFAAAVMAIMIRSTRDPSTRPALWVLTSVLVSKAISGPDLATPSGLLWIALGVLAAVPAATLHLSDNQAPQCPSRPLGRHLVRSAPRRRNSKRQPSSDSPRPIDTRVPRTTGNLAR